MANALIFDVAGPADDDAICALNYQTFVEEIPQHAPNPSKRLVDRYHGQNTYLVARDGTEIVGMVAVRAERPFSLDIKVANLDRYLPPHQGLCEVRLLCVKAGRRREPVFAGLMDRVMQLGRERGYDLAVISGTTRQARLYGHMGFVAFGGEVGTDQARYQPMYMTMSAFERDTGAAFARRAKLNRRTKPQPTAPPTSFLPGPVAIAPVVKRAFEAPASSHRSAPFLAQVQEARERLQRLTHADDATLLLGSGTLANDVIGGQIWKTGGPGVVVVDGEFGRRLADHAERWSLPHRRFEREWGDPWTPAELATFLDEGPSPRWLWLTLCETSTGVLREVDELRRVCEARGIDLYLDAVSAVGSVPVDLRGVRMASAVSGKALGAYPGIAIVLESSSPGPWLPQRSERTLPRYLDLDLYRQADGVPFTQSSNLMAALVAALRRLENDDAVHRTAELGRWVRTQMAERQLPPMGSRSAVPERISPAVTTIELPPSLAARAVGDALQAAGFHISYESEYLIARNWIQICLMGAFERRNVEALLLALDKIMARMGPELVGSGR